MRKIVLYIAMSLDGFLADTKGGVQWLKGDGSDKDNKGSYPAFYDTIDTVILGYRTYHQIVSELAPNEWMYKGKKTYVLTHKTLEAADEIEFINGSVTNLVRELHEQNGKAVWICGGANIANQLIESDMIDEYCVSLIPTLLGDGIRLFNTHPKAIDLRLLSTRHYDGIVDVVYARR